MTKHPHSSGILHSHHRTDPTLSNSSLGRSSIVLLSTGRKLIVLLQLLPFCSPHRERPAFVLLGLLTCCSRRFSILCGIGRWVQLDIVMGCQISETFEIQFGSIPLLLRLRIKKKKKTLKEFSWFFLHWTEL